MFAVQAARVFTGTQEGWVVAEEGRHVYVLIDGGRIEGISFDAPKDRPVERFAGMSVLPGLIDMHCHVLYVTPAEARLPRGEMLTRAVLRAGQNAQRCLVRGVTSVRDLGASGHEIHEVVRSIDEGWLAGPRIIAAGIGITVSGGHGCDRIALEVDGADAFRAAVRTEMKHGADWIKLMLTGGVGDLRESMWECQATREEIAAAIEETHRKGHRITAHISNSPTARDAIELGIDGIEHGHHLDAETFELMARSGTYLTPTLEVYHRIADRPGLDAHMKERSLALLEPHTEAVRRAYRAGVRILAGTDSGQEFWPLGDLAYEIARLESAGISNHDALMSATGLAADALGLTGEIGAIVSGATADLLVVPGDASQSSMTLAEPAAVFKGGRRVVVSDGVAATA
jgi:Imidazolonepropionase and related amidohydrolases